MLVKDSLQEHLDYIGSRPTVDERFERFNDVAEFRLRAQASA
jgi:hypothetical protein